MEGFVGFLEPHQAVEAGVVSYSFAVFVNSKWVDIIYLNLFFVCVCVCVFNSVSSKPGICASENVLEKTRGECLAGISNS